MKIVNGDIMTVIECTSKLVLKIGKWKEQIFLNIVSLIEHQVILGTPWLGKHNPDVDWRSRLLKLMYQGVNCLETRRNDAI